MTDRGRARALARMDLVHDAGDVNITHVNERAWLLLGGAGLLLLPISPAMCGLLPRVRSLNYHADWWHEFSVRSQSRHGWRVASRISVEAGVRQQLEYVLVWQWLAYWPVLLGRSLHLKCRLVESTSVVSVEVL